MIRPAMVLVTELESGTVLIQGYPSGPTTSVRGADAELLRRALVAVTESDSGDSAYSRIAAPPIVRPRVQERY